MAENSGYKKGTIKLTWVSDHDPNELNSMMFNNQSDAIEYAKENGKKDFLIFKLIWTKNDRYKWVVQPYKSGAYYPFKIGMRINESPLLKFAAGSLMVLGVFFLGKTVISKTK